MSQDNLEISRLSSRPRCLDLFCGLGGWSKGFVAAGFDCLGVDLASVGYPFEFIQSDIRDFSTDEYFDAVVASPPCRDSSITTSFGKIYWKDKPDARRTIELAEEAKRIIRKVKPRFWVIENVPGLADNWFWEKPRMTIRMRPSMRRVLWGNFPDFLVSTTEGPLKQDIFGKLRSWQRAEIPFPVAYSLASSCKSILE